jgi:hypothetical protein
MDPNNRGTVYRYKAQVNLKFRQRRATKVPKFLCKNPAAVRTNETARVTELHEPATKRQLCESMCGVVA